MAKTFTPDFLLQYSYGELSENDRREAETLCEQDPYLRDELVMINESKELLNEVEVRPSDRTIQNILSFSKAYHVSKLSDGSQAEMVLN
ncbi:MAG: hypothetical protein J4F31_09060 [Flavobacteriales bacterium]|nr:hypothetical protein [Flavobacteriales bacterium]